MNKRDGHAKPRWSAGIISDHLAKLTKPIECAVAAFDGVVDRVERTAADLDSDLDYEIVAAWLRSGEVFVYLRRNGEVAVVDPEGPMEWCDAPGYDLRALCRAAVDESGASSDPEDHQDDLLDLEGILGALDDCRKLISDGIDRIRRA